MTEENDVHLPAVEDFAKLPEDVGLMAIMGALMHLGSAFEPVYYRLYKAALGLQDAVAGETFYSRDMSLGRRQQLTGEAIRPTLDPEGVATWDGIWSRLRSATGREGSRNFFGHAPVRRRRGLFDRAIFDPAIFDTERFAAEQAKLQASLRSEKPRMEGFGAALNSYEELMKVYKDLLAFTVRYEDGTFR